jgi:hypothetical protein
MPTSVHIPDHLLKQADKRAEAIGISRNRLIVRALERELREGSEWSPQFFNRLREIDGDGKAAVEEMLSAIRQNRRSKQPPRL